MAANDQAKPLHPPFPSISLSLSPPICPACPCSTSSIHLPSLHIIPPSIPLHQGEEQCQIPTRARPSWAVWTTPPSSSVSPCGCLTPGSASMSSHNPPLPSTICNTSVFHITSQMPPRVPQVPVTLDSWNLHKRMINGDCFFFF